MRIQLDWFNEKLATRLADLEAGRVTPPRPRDAATIMVLRSLTDGTGVEVLMLRRTAAMKFAPGAYVFPGGSVDPADYGAEIGWQGPSAAEFGARLGASAEVARALVCAAVRETFEESGVLLAGRAGRRRPLAAPSGPSWEADRMAVASGTLTLAELLVQARPRASRGPAGPVGPLDHAGGRAAPVRRAVLRGRPARRPGGGRPRGGGGPRRLAAPCRRHRRPRRRGRSRCFPRRRRHSTTSRPPSRPAPGSRTSSPSAA